MIEGVRMRLAVTVWKTTVETAIATPTCASASSLMARSSSANQMLPRRPTPI